MPAKEGNGKLIKQNYKKGFFSDYTAASRKYLLAELAS
jgi:hypothetical protein